jgi:hypothetical protein
MSDADNVDVDLRSAIEHLDRLLETLQDAMLDAISQYEYDRVSSLAKIADRVSTFRAGMSEKLNDWESSISGNFAILLPDGNADGAKVNVDEYLGSLQQGAAPSEPKITHEHRVTLESTRSHSTQRQSPKVPGELSDQAGGRKVEMSYGSASAMGLFVNANKIIVLAGSRLKANSHDSLPEPEKERRRDLKRQGILTDESFDIMRLTTDQVFGSVSAAAKFVAGASVNGRDYWRFIDTGETVGEFLGSKRHWHL